MFQFQGRAFHHHCQLCWMSEGHNYDRAYSDDTVITMITIHSDNAISSGLFVLASEKWKTCSSTFFQFVSMYLFYFKVQFSSAWKEKEKQSTMLHYHSIENIVVFVCMKNLLFHLFFNLILFSSEVQFSSASKILWFLSVVVFCEKKCWRLAC